MDIKALYNEYVPWNIFQELLEIEYTLYDHLYQEEFFEDIDFEDLLKKEYHLLSELQTLSEKCNITRCSIPLVAKYIAALPHSDTVDKENTHLHRMSVLYQIRSQFVNEGFQKIEQLLFSNTQPLTLQSHLTQWCWSQLIQKVVLMLMTNLDSSNHIDTVLSNYQHYLNTQLPIMIGGGILKLFASITNENISKVNELFQTAKNQLTNNSDEKDIYNIYVMEHFWKMFINLFESDDLKYINFIKLIEGLEGSTPMFVTEIKNLLQLN